MCCFAMLFIEMCCFTEMFIIGIYCFTLVLLCFSWKCIVLRWFYCFSLKCIVLLMFCYAFHGNELFYLGFPLLFLGLLVFLCFSNLSFYFPKQLVAEGFLITFPQRVCEGRPPDPLPGCPVPLPEQ